MIFTKYYLVSKYNILNKLLIVSKFIIFNKYDSVWVELVWSGYIWGGLVKLSDAEGSVHLVGLPYHQREGQVWADPTLLVPSWFQYFELEWYEWKVGWIN